MIAVARPLWTRAEGQSDETRRRKQLSHGYRMRIGRGGDEVSGAACGSDEVAVPACTAPRSRARAVAEKSRRRRQRQKMGGRQREESKGEEMGKTGDEAADGR
jgi:hypothetical protein